MNISVHQPRAEPSRTSGVCQFISKGLGLFFGDIERRSKSNLLDVGPICGENINFLAQRAGKLYVCDLFLRLHRTLRKRKSPTSVFRYLDYPEESFDGILLWELIDRYDNEATGQLVEACNAMLKPGGIVMIFALEASTTSHPVNNFAISSGFLVHPCRQYHLELPFYGRHNRGLVEMMTPLVLVKSFIYNNGIREFLFRRPAKSKEEISTLTFKDVV